VQPRIFTTDEHDINPDHIDRDALAVILRLQQAGFSAYLVGGGVRDLLIHQVPKDFDVSTSATPEEIKRLFRRQCILIGRRFRLAHIRFGKKVIEVSTFRSGDNEEDELITRDNCWGSPEEDALRRDFTINGLFYDPSNHSIIDFVGGWDDVHKMLLRTIGKPDARFKQDPVRMLRALKFQARLGFFLEEDTERAVKECYEEIAKSSTHRLLEEIFKMLESGASAPFFKLMVKYGMLSTLFPKLTNFLAGPHGEAVYDYLDAADKAKDLNHGMALERPVLTACLLYPILEREVQIQFIDKGIVPHMGHIIMLTSAIIKAAITEAFSHFPRRIASSVNFILSTQYRFTPTSKKKHFRPSLFQHKEFPMALHFLRLRSVANPEITDIYDNWKRRCTRKRRAPQKKHHPAPHGH